MKYFFDASENVEVKEAGAKGKSLFALKDFKKDELVFVQYGAIVNYHTDYTIPIDHDLMIEPRLPGSPGQFMCHSCDPNLGIKNRTLFVAMRDIKKGEEVVTNYAFLGYDYGTEKTLDGKETIELNIKCECGSPNCEGVWGSYKHLTPEKRALWREYISEYLLDDARYPYVPR